MDLKETEKAYLAGLFDGEGSVGYYNGCVYITITNTDAAVFSWIRSITSIGIIKSRSRVGSLGKRPTWEWSVRNKQDGRVVLEAMRPFLIIKASQVDLLFSLWDAEEEAKCGRNRKVPAHVAAQRIATEQQLRQLKVAASPSVH